MIQQEKLSDTLIRTYSDSGYKIQQIETMRIYDEAIDRLPTQYTYRETKERIRTDMDTNDPYNTPFV